MTGIPQSVYTIGGRYGYMDNGDVPNSFLAVYEYEGIKIVYESRALSEHPDSENMDGLKTISATGKSIFFPHDSKSPNTHEAFICEHGILYNDSIYDNNGTLISSIKADGSIEALEHFIEAVKSRDVSDLRIDIDEGHLSTAFCHLGNISYKLGKQESLSNIYKKLEDHPFLMDSFRGFEKHLSVHGIDISEQLPVLGPKLLFDSKMEAFHGPNSNMANLFLKDTYREPFQIPEDV
jgi:hypothetical protein